MKSCIVFELKGNVHTSGFMPFFWQITGEAGLTGEITYSQDGVLLRLVGTDEKISSFIRSLPHLIPNAYRLNTVTILQRKTDLKDEDCPAGFKVRNVQPFDFEIKPDLAPCEQCVQEILDPSSRRYLYPFTACSKCGPGYSYIIRVPFLRGNTDLTAFPMCKRCSDEKENPEDHHHHGSELLACRECGPQFFLLDTYGDLVTDENPLKLTRQALFNGDIVAFQSLSGYFEIMADAFQENTIQRLRRKRQLPDRPLSLMARNMEVIRRYCECSPEEEALLTSKEAPSVILQKKKDPFPWPPLPRNISPDTDTLAMGLPSSLPEKLLFELPDERPLDLLVTCGDNRPGKAECLDIDEVFNRLMAFTDRFLCHDLKTSYVCSRSVMQIRDRKPVFIRKARGFVPGTACLHKKMPVTVGAFGCDARAAVALGYGNVIRQSQWLGSLDGHFETAILKDLFNRFMCLYDRVPDIMACDMDRDSYSSQACSAFAETYNLPLITIQTHHAHALACMAEHHLERSLAIVFNNGSCGPDGAEWGAECMDCRLDGFSRLGSYKPDSRTVTRPVHIFLTHLMEHSIEPSPALLEKLRVTEAECQLWQHQMTHETEPVLTHSALRVINTICAGLGIAPDFCTYPEQCMMILQKYAARYVDGTNIPPEISGVFQFRLEKENDFCQVSWDETWRNLSRLAPIPEELRPLYARSAYDALARSIIEMSIFAREKTGLNDIVLSGSLFLDKVLRSTVQYKLSDEKFHVYTHEQTSCDESCVPLGQAYAAGMTAR